MCAYIIKLQEQKKARCRDVLFVRFAAIVGCISHTHKKKSFIKSEDFKQKQLNAALAPGWVYVHVLSKCMSVKKKWKMGEVSVFFYDVSLLVTSMAASIYLFPALHTNISPCSLPSGTNSSAPPFSLFFLTSSSLLVTVGFSLFSAPERKMWSDISPPPSSLEPAGIKC